MPSSATEAAPLSINSLKMQSDFPTQTFEAIFKIIEPISQAQQSIFEHIAGAMNAISYRFYAMAEHGERFTASIERAGTSPKPIDRYAQESELFGFFSNGFSVFEATSYMMFAFGASVAPSSFPIATPKDQQRISPKSTLEAFRAAFPSDSIHETFSSIADDAAYIEWREVRNILTHRAAPGRHFFVGIGTDEALPDQWKIRDIVLDNTMTSGRRAHLVRLLSAALIDFERFCDERRTNAEKS